MGEGIIWQQFMDKFENKLIIYIYKCQYIAAEILVQNEQGSCLILFCSTICAKGSAGINYMIYIAIHFHVLFSF